MSPFWQFDKWCLHDDEWCLPAYKWCLHTEDASDATRIIWGPWNLRLVTVTVQMTLTAILSCHQFCCFHTLQHTTAWKTRRVFLNLKFNWAKRSLLSISHLLVQREIEIHKQFESWILIDLLCRKVKLEVLEYRPNFPFSW